MLSLTIGEKVQHVDFGIQDHGQIHCNIFNVVILNTGPGQFHNECNGMISNSVLRTVP